jgi:hypothetical protein
MQPSMTEGDLRRHSSQPSLFSNDREDDMPPVPTHPSPGVLPPAFKASYFASSSPINLPPSKPSSSLLPPPTSFPIPRSPNRSSEDRAAADLARASFVTSTSAGTNERISGLIQEFPVPPNPDDETTSTSNMLSAYFAASSSPSTGADDR